MCKIDRQMNLGEVASHMGSVATTDEARAMRDILNREAAARGWQTLADIPERDWAVMVQEAVEATEKLRALLLRAADYIDPHHEADGWPDPIAWDGRPLAEQASDACVLLDSWAADEDDDEARNISAALWAAVQ